MTTTLTDFLLARIAEDEAVARKAAADHGREHWAVGGGDEYVYPDPPPGNSYVAVGPWDGGIGPAAAHIARHDPARVLAECEKNRRIVELHNRAHECSTLRDGEVDNCTWCLDGDECTTLRLLALPYAEHADFDPAWRP